MLTFYRNRCGFGHHPLMNTIKAILGPKIKEDEIKARYSYNSAGEEIFGLDIRDGANDLEINDSENEETGLEEVNQRKRRSSYKVVCCK